MKDFALTCLDTFGLKGKDPEEIKALGETYCYRCWRKDCLRARAEDTLWNHRMATQEDRLLINPNFADPDDPKYDNIRKLNFEDLFNRAIQLQNRPSGFAPSAEDLGWGTQEEPEGDLSVIAEPKQTEAVDSAAKALAEARGNIKLTIDPPEPAPVEKEEPVSRIPTSADEAPRTIQNTVISNGGMIGGPAERRRRRIDVWAPKEKRKGLVTVGGTIKLGGKKPNTSE